jgi:hypothetical protein
VSNPPCTQKGKSAIGRLPWFVMNETDQMQAELLSDSAGLTLARDSAQSRDAQMTFRAYCQYRQLHSSVNAD